MPVPPPPPTDAAAAAAAAAAAVCSWKKWEAAGLKAAEKALRAAACSRWFASSFRWVSQIVIAFKDAVDRVNIFLEVINLKSDPIL